MIGMNAWVSVLGGTMAYSLGLCHLAVKLYCLPLILVFETMSAHTERCKAEPWKQLCTAGVCWGNRSCDRESCRACQGWQQLADLWCYSSWWHSDTGIALCVYVPALCDILIWVSHSVSVFWHSDTGIALCVYVPALCDILIWVSHSVSVFWHSDTGIALCVYVPALCDILIWVSHSVSVFMYVLYVTTFRYRYHPLSVSLCTCSVWHSDIGVTLCIWVPALCDYIQIQVSHSVFMYLLYMVTFRYRYHSLSVSLCTCSMWHSDTGITLCVFRYLLCVTTFRYKYHTLCIYVPALHDDIQIQASHSVHLWTCLCECIVGWGGIKKRLTCIFLVYIIYVILYGIQTNLAL